MRRSALSIEWTNRLTETGFFREPTPADQVRLIGGDIVPTWGSGTGEGRGPIVFDLIREKDSQGISLKFGSKNVTTRVVTCGTDRHINAVIDRLMKPSPLWVVVSVDTELGFDLLAFNLARVFREHGINPATRGQGKQNNNPLRLRDNCPRDKTDKTYTEINLGWKCTRADATAQVTSVEKFAEFLNSLG
jgi:hypothetical protein